MNKHYSFIKWGIALRQRYTGRVVFHNVKLCLDNYFWLIIRFWTFFLPILWIMTIPACNSAQDKIAMQEAAARQAAGKQTAPPDGMAVFRQYCVTCHGADGKLGLNGAKDLSQSALSLEERITQITNGKNLMTPFRNLLTPAEIKAVAAYTQDLKSK